MLSPCLFIVSFRLVTGLPFIPVYLIPFPGRRAKITSRDTGRAVYTLRTTLPNFFETGLVSKVDHDPDLSPSQVTSRAYTQDERSRGQQTPESIYAPNIRLSYTPPTALSLPSAFPKTLQVEGTVRLFKLSGCKLTFCKVSHCIMLQRRLLDTR